MTIYRDPLGRPEPKAAISVYGGPVYGTKMGKGAYFSLGSVSDAPRLRWEYTSKDVSHIVKQMDAMGFDCVVSKDGYGDPVIHLTHRETATALKASQVTLTGKGESGYVRYGDCPKSGYSINHATGEKEKGVSVYEATFYRDGYEVSKPHYSTGTFESVRAQGRPVYRVWGKVVGAGSDGEPVLKVTRTKRIG